MGCLVWHQQSIIKSYLTSFHIVKFYYYAIFIKFYKLNSRFIFLWILERLWYLRDPVVALGPHERQCAGVGGGRWLGGVQLRHRLGNPPQHGAVTHLAHVYGASGQIAVARPVVELEVDRRGQASSVQQMRRYELRVTIDERLRARSVYAHEHHVVLRTVLVVQPHQLVGDAVVEHLGPGAGWAPIRSHVTQEVAFEAFQEVLSVYLDRDVRPDDVAYVASGHGHVKRRWG